MPVISTRAIDPARLIHPAEPTRAATGRSCVWIATVVPVTPLPDLSVAVDRALDATGADALWDTRVTYEIAYVPPLGGRTCYAVHGTVP